MQTMFSIFAWHVPLALFQTRWLTIASPAMLDNILHQNLSVVQTVDHRSIRLLLRNLVQSVQLDNTPKRKHLSVPLVR
jgi:hypothetical protein